MGNRLSLAVLGPPEVRRGRSRLAFTTRKALAILIYLAVERGRHAREELLAIFWPEADTARARASLRTTLTFLRQALAEVPGLDGGDIVADVDAVEVNPEARPALDLDVMVDGLEAAGGPRSPEAISRLQAAAAVYRGDFLSGFVVRDAPGFDDWATVQREHWHIQLSHVYGSLSTWLAEVGQMDRARQTAARWVGHDRLNEAAQRQLIRLHDAAGNRTAALQAYVAYQALLRAELGVEPAPETQALADQLRKRGSLLAGGADMPRRQALWVAPFAGRASEHADLVALYEQARTGSAVAAVLLGEAGIGKTRLAQEFQRWATAVGATTAMGQAVETGVRPPYQPLAQVLRSNPPPASLSPTWLSELSRLLPELREQWPELAKPIEDDSAAPTRLFEALACWLEALARPGPLVMTLDDLPWADAATLDVLRFLARRWSSRPAPVLLILTARTADLSGPMQGWLGDLSRDLPLRRVSLAPLAVEAVSQLVANLAADSGEQAKPLGVFSRWLWSQTDGQPLFVVETLQALRQQGLLKWQPADVASRLDVIEAANAIAGLSGWLAPGVRSLMAARLAPLSASAADLLAAGAVLGQQFAYDDLRDIAELSDTEALRALDEVQAAELLRPLPAGRGELPPSQVGFVHDRIRALVYERAGPARRLVLHRRAYASLLTARASQATLAYHAWQGALASAAFTHSLAAGKDALAVFAVADAIELLERARHLAETEPVNSADTAALSELFSRLGRAYQLTDQLGQAQAVFEAMRAIAKTRADVSMEITALNRLATLLAQGPSELEAARRLLTQAATLAEQTGDKRALAETTWNLAQLGIYSLDIQSAFDIGTRALALAQSAIEYTSGQQASELVGQCQNVLAYACLGLGRWDGAVEAARASASYYQEVGNAAMEADSLGVLANVQHRRGDLLAATATARALHARASGIGNMWGQLHAYVYLVQASADSGQVDEALATAETMEALAEAQDAVPWWQVMALAVRGAAERAGMLLTEAHAHHTQALTLCREYGLPPAFEAALQVERCADCALLDDWDQATTAAQLALAHQFELLPFGYTRRAVVQALVQSRDLQSAEAVLHQLESVAVGNPRYQLDAASCRALLQAGRGQAQEAVRTMEQALSWAGTQLALPTELWQIYALLGQLHSHVGNRFAARRAFGEAATHITLLAAGLSSNDHLRFVAARPVREILEVAGTPGRRKRRREHNDSLRTIE